MASRSSSTEHHEHQPIRDSSEPHHNGHHHHHHHTQHRSAQRRERLRRIEERHRELGRILEEAIGGTDTGNEPLADNLSSGQGTPPSPVRQPQEGVDDADGEHEWMGNPLERLNPHQHVAPHVGAKNRASSNVDHRRRHQRYDIPPAAQQGPIAVVATTTASATEDAVSPPPTQTGAFVESLEALVVSQEGPPLHAAPTDIMDHPIVRSLEGQIEALHEKYTATEARLAAAQVKTEALARNLVKALRERNHFEEDLLSRKTDSATGRNSTMDDLYSTAQGTSGGNAHEELQHALRVKENELEQSYRELDRLVSLGLRDRLRADSAWGGEQNVDAQAAFLESDVKRLTTALSATESQRDRLAAELRLSASCIETLDQRLLVSERELLQARLALAAAQATGDSMVSVVGRSAGAGDDAKEIDLSTLPLSVRKHMARLTAEASTLHERMQQMLADEHHRGHFDRDLQAELRAHNSALESQMASILTSLDDEIRDHTRTAEAAARDRQALLRLQNQAELVANTIATSRTDVDKVLELTGSLGMNDICASAVRRFGNQVSRDLAAMAQLLSSARAMSEPATAMRTETPANGGGVWPRPSRSQGNEGPLQTAATARRRIPSPSANATEPPSSRLTPAAGGDATTAAVSNLAWKRSLPPPSERSPSPANPTTPSLGQRSNAPQR